MKYDIGLGYQEPWDVTSARWLLKRPLRTASARVTKNFESVSMGFEVLSVGERLDRLSSTVYGGLDPYTITNLFATKNISQNLNAYLRAQNIFDSRYEESSGYHNEGSFYLVGIEIKH
jgi:outer membrane cobalamin receptor